MDCVNSFCLSDKLDQSEEKLYTISNQKKREVSDQIQKLIDRIRELEDDFHNEIDEFKNNRLAYVVFCKIFVFLKNKYFFNFSSIFFEGF